ncbi:hypothetical protein AWB78_07161 [Caballeronia calidae]|uniref:Uncharacterized protein n=1 Tax=Caballeronia calidae TaxID=1777139 RepID=A0A158ED76_9BURK|nr:hypothetical protein [Caballeronia calidae]SAL04849.1 hypothetical protein AWB78_07161 [Caballeronia calidae]
MTPLNPKLLRGAIVFFALPDPVPSAILFQYNPASLQRSMEIRTAGGGEAAGEEAFRVDDAPVETIKVDIEFDATDDGLGGGVNGVLSRLAALELLITPNTATVIANTILAQVGAIELLPPQAPFTLFVYGGHRILPVRVTEYSVTEDAYESALKPIRAKVSLGLKVLTYSDLPGSHPGHHLYLAHQVAKEALAKATTVQGLDAVLGPNARIL